ncbi:hypothetical protein QJU96_04115 [Pasteurella skyensis]|uniref:Uncharacterized protein n=1 Tax=Phocoenobacter skyensis TaxID=97481 RepID=A0AAJ6ND34_9PAST|nr:hypothetical protein [Pasteurella skyensis]MDP8170472.1 hypothetical protein [Pasteurella skyensis]MDP8174566.1 hypothetical protein [Pasteurella skyensis]
MKKLILLVLIVKTALSTEFEKQFLDSINFIDNNNKLSDYKDFAKKNKVILDYRNTDSYKFYELVFSEPRVGYIDTSLLRSKNNTILGISITIKSNPNDSAIFGIFNKLRKDLLRNGYKLSKNRSKTSYDSVNNYGDQTCYYSGMEIKDIDMKKGNMSVSLWARKGGQFEKCYKYNNLVSNEIHDATLEISYYSE